MTVRSDHLIATRGCNISLGQCSFKIAPQIACVLQPDRQTDQPRGDAQQVLLILRQALMGGGGRMRRNRARIAQVVGNHNDFKGIHETERGILAAFQLERKDRAGAIHDPAGHRMLRMAGQAGKQHLRNRGMRRQLFSQRLRAGRLCPHAQIHRRQPVQHDPGVERAHRAAGVLHVGLDRAAHHVARTTDHPAQAPPLPVDVLGRRIDDDVGALRRRAAEDGRGEHVVHHHHRPRRMGKLGDSGQVDHLEPGVGNAFQKNQPRAGRDRRAPLVQIGPVNQNHRHAKAAQHFLEHVEARPEQRPRRDHPVTGLAQRHQGARHRRHAAGGGKGGLASFQRGDPVFEGGNGGIAVAGIDELVLAGLDEPRLG